jgi:hypothetical protein
MTAYPLLAGLVAMARDGQSQNCDARLGIALDSPAAKWRSYTAASGKASGTEPKHLIAVRELDQAAAD